jgi:pSer/pThr/pTyr-binding forkhead associated (FHA) protein
MSSKSSYTIGRDRTCHFVLSDHSVSRVHAELTVVAGNQFLLTDRNSSNGTFVIRNGKDKRIHQAQVSLRDEVRFGATVVIVGDILAALNRHAAPIQSTQTPTR